tara:strand:+ start:584 stop:772 length:189 start_codon:yes stop_codon:yes gene_type:complete
MKFSWNEAIIWLCILSLTVTMSAELISDYTGIDPWSILYFGIGLSAISALLIIIFRFKQKKK